MEKCFLVDVYPSFVKFSCLIFVLDSEILDNLVNFQETKNHSDWKQLQHRLNFKSLITKKNSSNQENEEENLV